ncbi:response regulator transcription factor [Limnobacter humi]|uniref:Response regulator transcription factor n=1 Tax=Limnobacter humi TaxID=1778671 RepID=A0ABT1WJQ8_9BURK|nr:response regulator transcription factor [Limnobacter humi]MCQ8897276.1 response regulator transcription factor [Limnobacter humi]
MAGRTSPGRDSSALNPSSVSRTVSLQPMFVTNRTTLAEIDNHLASAETRIVVVTLEKGSSHGETVVEHIGEHYADVRIVLVCEGSAQDILAMAFKQGVWACVGRQSSVETLREAIDTVAAGVRFVAPELVNAKPNATHTPERTELGGKLNTFQDDEETTQLTRRERQVLTLIAQGRPRREIAELLKVSPRTIDAYRARLLQKLSLDSSVQLVKYAISAGLAS